MLRPLGKTIEHRIYVNMYVNLILRFYKLWLCTSTISLHVAPAEIDIQIWDTIW